MLRLLTETRENLINMDAGIIPSGTSKQIHLKVANPDATAYTNVTVKLYDYNTDNTGRSAKSIILGGTGLEENATQSFVYASNDGSIWKKVAGESAYLTVIPLGETIDPGQEEDFYLKIEIPEGKILNMQKFNLAVFGTPTTVIE
jgi:hypothetical protein